MPKKATKRPIREKRERGATIAQALDAIAALVDKPHTPQELADALGCSRRTAERLLSAFASAGLPVTSERSESLGYGKHGLHSYHSIAKDDVRKRLGVDR